MKKFLSLILILIFCITAFSSCGSEPEYDENGACKLSFKEAQSIDFMKSINGKTVTIVGYMSTLSPVQGNFMYLMNMPYQSCPFCIPNTTQLSNTMAVYAPEGKEFEFTDRAIKVTGIMDFGDYTDEFGYQYSYRISNATYEIYTPDEADADIIAWQQISASGIVSKIDSMYQYLNFVCNWTTYYANFGGNPDYLWPSDVPNFLNGEGQYAYGNAEGYFENLKAEANEHSHERIQALIENIDKAEALASRALDEHAKENYTQVPEYTGVYNDGRQQYKMNDVTLEAECRALYSEYADWLASWEI